MLIKNIKVFICAVSLFTVSLYAQSGIVDTNVLLIKKEPSEASVKFGYYKKSQTIEIDGKFDGLDSDDMWYKTTRGFVKAKYVILEDELPQFISSKEVDYSKYALQLIVYQSTVVESLRKLRILLKNENNLYLQKIKNVYVVYLTNFDSYSKALQKSQELTKKFPTNFVVKIKNKKYSEVKNKKYTEIKISKSVKNKLKIKNIVNKKEESEDYYNNSGEFKEEYMTNEELKSLGMDKNDDVNSYYEEEIESKKQNQKIKIQEKAKEKKRLEKIKTQEKAKEKKRLQIYEKQKLLNRKNNLLKKEKVRLEQQVQSETKKLDKLKSDISQKELVLNNLRSEINNKQSIVKNLNNEIDNLKKKRKLENEKLKSSIDYSIENILIGLD